MTTCSRYLRTPLLPLKFEPSVLMRCNFPTMMNYSSNLTPQASLQWQKMRLFFYLFIKILQNLPSFLWSRFGFFWAPVPDWCLFPLPKRITLLKPTNIYLTLYWNTYLEVTFRNSYHFRDGPRTHEDVAKKAPYPILSPPRPHLLSHRFRL